MADNCFTMLCWFLRITAWISCRYMMSPASWASLLPPTPSHPPACLVALGLSFLCHTANFHWLSSFMYGFVVIVAVQSLSHVQLFVTLCIAACQASLPFSISWSLLKFMSIELMMPSNHLILCHPLLLPSIFSSIRVFSSESALCIRWPKALVLQHQAF